MTRPDPARGSGTCLASDMVLVHKVFRRELRMLPALVAAVEPARVDRAALLGKHYRDLATALRQHHQAERDLLWRRLTERTQLDPALEDRMRQGHRRHERARSAGGHPGLTGLALLRPPRRDRAAGAARGRSAFHPARMAGPGTA